MTSAEYPTEQDLDDDLMITQVVQREIAPGTWVSGRMHGHRFEALVFAEHAANADWELGDSRISKLWIQRLADGQVVFNWDRGPDIPAADEVAGAIADFLAGGLADYVYHD